MGTERAYSYSFRTRITEQEAPFIRQVPNLTIVKMYTYVHSDNDDNFKFSVEVDTYLRFIVLQFVGKWFSKFAKRQLLFQRRAATKKSYQ